MNIPPKTEAKKMNLPIISGQQGKPIHEKYDHDEYGRFSLSRGLLGRLLRSRWIPFLPIVAMLMGFVVIITSGLPWFFGLPVGTTLGSASFGVVVAWILWFFLLITIFVPIFGRGWCTVCPLPAIGEWLDRKSLVAAKNADKKGTKKRLGLHKKWPKWLNNVWLVNFGFVGMAIFSPFLTTHGDLSSYAFIILLIIPIITALVWEKRVFCKHMCPIGGFQGLYANFAPTELRVNDRDICKGHKGKQCIVGAEGVGYGCQWFEFPQTLKRNTYCGLCFECIKTCPTDNISWNIRPFAVDLYREDSKKSVSEAWKAHIMLALAAVYTVVLLGPFGFIKDWSIMEAGMGNWLLYVFFFVGTSMLFVPFLYILVTHLSRVMGGKRDANLKYLFTEFSMVLVPIGLLSWISFIVHVILVNWSYMAVVFSDPYGWGWDLLGTKGVHWEPFYPIFVPWINLGFLFLGLWWSLKVLRGLSEKHFEGRRSQILAQIPYIGFLGLFSLIMLRLWFG